MGLFFKDAFIPFKDSFLLWVAVLLGSAEPLVAARRQMPVPKAPLSYVRLHCFRINLYQLRVSVLFDLFGSEIPSLKALDRGEFFACGEKEG